MRQPTGRSAAIASRIVTSDPVWIRVPQTCELPRSSAVGSTTGRSTDGRAPDRLRSRRAKTRATSVRDARRHASARRIASRPAGSIESTELCPVELVDPPVRRPAGPGPRLTAPVERGPQLVRCRPGLEAARPPRPPGAGGRTAEDAPVLAVDAVAHAFGGTEHEGGDVAPRDPVPGIGSEGVDQCAFRRVTVTEAFDGDRVRGTRSEATRLHDARLGRPRVDDAPRPAGPGSRSP